MEDPIRQENKEGHILFMVSRIENPSNLLDREIEMDLGNLKIQILFTPGHTKTNLSIFIPQDKVLYSGDCIVNQFNPNITEGSVEDWKLWLQSLQRIKDLSPQKILPGHGSIFDGVKQLQEEIMRIEQYIQNEIDLT